MSIFAKLFNRMLLHRIRSVLIPHLRPNQNGYLPLKSTTQHILALRRLIEEIESTKNGKVILTFIDFSKAFDSIDWAYIKAILLSYDVPQELVDRIMMIYYNAQARVKVEGNLSDPFDLGVGVLQGDTLAPFLFIIVIDWVLRNAIPTEDLPFLGFQLTKPKGTKTRPTSEAKYLTDLDYCDDISLISATLEGAQRLLLNVEKWALKVGLKINVPKTEFLAIGNWNTELDSPSGLNLCMSDGTRLNLVKNFRYLGSWIRDSTPDFKARAAQSWTAVKKLRRLWTSKILDNDVRKKFFYFLVVPISSYGSTAWTINKTLQNRIDSSFRRMYRYAQNIKWTEHIKNKDVFVNVTPASKLIARHRLRFIGHCW